MKIGVILLLLFFLTGCWDKRELEQLGFVVAIGIDQAKNNKLDVTFQIANPEVGTSLMGSPPPDEKPENIMTLTVPDFLTARNTANAFSSRQIVFSQVQTVIVSEEFARKKDFLKTIYAAIRERELRKEINIIISKEPAQQFIRNINPKMETRPHKYYQLIIERATETGIVPPSDLLRYLEAVEADADLFLAMYATAENRDKNTPNNFEDEYMPGQIPRKGGGQAEFIGSAVFKQGVMIGALSGEETRAALILDPILSVQDLLATYKDPIKKKYRIATRLAVPVKEDVKLKMNLNKFNPSISVEVPLSLEILGVPSLVNYSTNKKNREILKHSIEKDIEKGLKKLIERSQTEFKGEPFHWALTAQRKFLTMKEYEDFDWMKTYPRMDISVKVMVSFKNFGQQIQTPNMKVVED